MKLKLKKEKVKPTHSILSNMIYLMKLQWQNGGQLSYILGLISIPLSLGISFCGIYFPKLVFAEIGSGESQYHIIIAIGAFGLLIALLNILSKIKESYSNRNLSVYRNNVWYLKYRKTIFTDYENMESAKFKILSQRAEESLWQSGPHGALTGMTNYYSSLTTNVLGYFMFSAVISIINPWIAVLLTVTALINYFVVKAIQNFQFKYREENAVLERKLWYIATNTGSFDSVKDIKIYGMNTWFINLYKTFTDRKLHIDAQLAKRNYVSNIVEALTILLRDGVAYIVLIYMAVNGNVTVDYFVLCFGAIGGFADWIRRILYDLNNMNGHSHLICDLRDFLNYPEKTKKENDSTTGDIELCNLSYLYENAESDTLKNISLTIKEGEKIALVGLNGAGKTTLIKNICGLYTPTSGDVYINGHDSCYEMFSVVFQDFHFLPITICETVSCKPENETDRNRVKECLRIAGLDKIDIDSKLNKQLNADGIDLSGGEKQKLLLARAIYKDAPILILDEPTSALDPIAESELYQKYNDITKNKTSIYISHRLASTRFCDRIILLDKGEIIESGTHDELMKLNGKYAYLFDIQSHYYKEERRR